MLKPKPADSDTIFARLVARNEQLDRQLAAHLGRHGLPPAALSMAAAKSARHRGRLDATRQRLARELADREPAAAATWKAITRPSPADLSAACRGPLLRV